MNQTKPIILFISPLFDCTWPDRAYAHVINLVAWVLHHWPTPAGRYISRHYSICPQK